MAYEYNTLVQKLLTIPGTKEHGPYQERGASGKGYQEKKLITNPVSLSITYTIATNASGEEGLPYDVDVSVLPQQEGGKARGKSKTVHTGKNGGKYRIINGNKVYLKK